MPLIWYLVVRLSIVCIQGKKLKWPNGTMMNEIVSSRCVLKHLRTACTVLKKCRGCLDTA